MDILKEMMSGRGSELMSALTESGFSTEQAGKFLPAAGESIGEALGQADVGAMLAQSDDPIAGLLGKIDVAAIAAKIGIDASMVETGLRAVLPQLLVALQGKGGGFSSLLGGIAGGKGGGGLGGLLKRGAGFLR